MNFQLNMTKKTEMADEAGEPPTDHERPGQKSPKGFLPAHRKV